MRDKAIDALLGLGLPGNLVGFKYIVEAVGIIDKNETVPMLDVYRKVGEKYKTTYVRVERGIRYAFSYLKKYGNKDLYESYFGKMTCNTNGNYLYTLLIKLRLGGKK